MLLELLELASNHTLAYDQPTLARLEKLHGKTMTLIIKPLDRAVSVTPQKEGLEFSYEISDSADVTLTATLGALIKITRDGMDDADLGPGELEISGDPIAGQRFAQVLAELNIDWQTLMTEQLGESPARAISFAAAQAREMADESRARLQQFLADTLTGEHGVLADKQSVERFLDEVDTIRADVDRLMAKLTRLRSQR